MLSFSNRPSTTVVLLLMLSFKFGFGQSLKELLKQAESDYPLLKAKRYEVQARTHQVSYTKSTAMPSLDVAYQANNATYNNITGMAYGQVFVPISGPPSTGNTYSGVYGSAAGLLINWDFFTFGQRTSKIESARAFLGYQEADASQEIFQHQIRTANAYLDAILAREVIRVFQKNLELSKDNVRIIKSLTVSGLRPGTDTASFSAELSKAKIELLTFEKQKAATELLLSQFLGGSTTFTIDSSFFNKLPISDFSDSIQSHPLIKLSESKLQMSLKEQNSLRKSLYPKLSFWGSAYARGSGIRYDGYVNSTDGLSFSRYNYGAGLTLSVPILKFVNVNHQLHAQQSLIKADEERLNLTKLELAKQNELAELTLSNAIKIAKESPAFYKSAEFCYRTLKSKYTSGLINYTDFVQSQYILIKSEADLKRAFIEAWKSLLFKAATTGDINVFLNQIN